MKKYLNYVIIVAISLLVGFSLFSLVTLSMTIIKGNKSTEEVERYLTFKYGDALQPIGYDDFGDPIYSDELPEIINEDIQEKQDNSLNIVLAFITANIFASVFGTLIYTIIYVVSRCFIFIKAEEAGWKAVVPFYSDYIFYKITFGNGLYFFTLFIPIVGIVFYIISNYKLVKCFDKGVGFFIGLILLPIVFYPILAFSKADYVGY